MVEYDLITKVLSHKFLAVDQEKLVESKLKNPQISMICHDRVSAYSLYRFDLDSFDFLPFFDDVRHVGAEKYVPLEGLREFCDYILVALVRDEVFVFFIELKSGKSAGADSQLEATETFYKYIEKTAIRIARRNGYGAFNDQNVTTRRIVLKNMPQYKSSTNVANNKINLSVSPIIFRGGSFPIRRFCDGN